jgi:hypothetical protein
LLHKNLLARQIAGRALFRNKRITNMQISTTRLPMQSSLKASAPVQAESTEAAAPSDSFSFSNASGGGHYSGGKIVARAAGGAITGLLANAFGDGSTWGTAKLGAVVNGVVGAGVGAIGGGLAGGVAGGGGGALAGAAIGAGVVGVPMAIGGGIKGALIGVVGNALGGGAVAFAGSGAILGALGL